MVTFVAWGFLDLSIYLSMYKCQPTATSRKKRPGEGRSVDRGPGEATRPPKRFSSRLKAQGPQFKAWGPFRTCNESKEEEEKKKLDCDRASRCRAKRDQRMATSRKKRPGDGRSVDRGPGNAPQRGELSKSKRTPPTPPGASPPSPPSDRSSSSSLSSFFERSRLYTVAAPFLR